MVKSISKTAPKKPQIILLEDEPLLVKLFEFCIAEWFKKTELLEFKNGDDAWQELSRMEPDLLIMDGTHPGLGGLEIMDRLAKKKAGCPILLTSDFFEEYLGSYTERGLKIYFLPKPFGVKQFWNALNQLVGPSDFPERSALPDA